MYSECACVAHASTAGNLSLSPYWRERAGLGGPLASSSSPVTGAVEGFCASDCDHMFYLTMAIFGTLSLLGSTGRVGGTIVSLRAVNPRDKSASLVILISFLSLFAFLPSPIIFGAMMDNACLIWGENCGEATNCLLYNTDSMRYYMCGFTAACLGLATLCDVGVWWHADGLQIWDEDSEDGGEKEEKQESEI